MRIVALEEHFVTQAVLEAWEGLPPEKQDPSLKQTRQAKPAHLLPEFGPERLHAMDEAGIEVQVLSLTTPGVQNLLPEVAVPLARDVNDHLLDIITGNPERFQGFATLPTPSPHAAARELERCVQRGLQGAMIFGRTGDRNLDHPDHWPLLETSAALRSPLYLHPQSPRPAVRQACYSGISTEVDALFALPGIGWHYETGLQIVRLALAGVFERFPDLRIVTGHMGEVILFYLDRLDMLSGPAKLPRKVSEYIRKHVYVTPSGLFSQRYLRWAIEILGADHILMSTDYPFVPTERRGPAAFLEASELSEEVRQRIASGNWEKLCTEIVR